MEKKSVKILAISDEPSKALWDYASKERFEGIELILSCGDLPIEYLEHITNFTTAPILYVHGNHDGCYAGKEPGGCTCVDGAVYTYRGLRILGLGGSIRYNKAATYQYTEWGMKRRIAKLEKEVRKAGGIDLLMTHSPAKGLNDGTDNAHRGFACFNTLLDKYQPHYYVHGHTHLNYDARLPRVCTRGETTVINATERYVFEIPDELLHSQPPKRKFFVFK
jgi:Icc-related predicted phosphoesterase